MPHFHILSIHSLVNGHLSLFIYLFIVSLGLQPCHMEVPWPGVKSELQLPAYTTAIAIPDPSRICHIHYSSQQHWILDPLSGARD